MIGSHTHSVGEDYRIAELEHQIQVLAIKYEILMEQFRAGYNPPPPGAKPPPPQTPPRVLSEKEINALKEAFKDGVVVKPKRMLRVRDEDKT